MTQPIIVRVEFTGQSRQGVSTKSGQPKPYWVQGAYATLPGLKYPQAIELFTFDAGQVKTAGLYDIPLVSSVKDNRPAFELDLAAALPVQAAAARA